MDCPTCGKSLSTEQGMRQHHTIVHGDPLPNRTCKGCGSEFYDEKAQLKYCVDCDPNAGEHNGNYKDATEEAVCTICDEEFEYYPSDKDGVYCPECVSESDGLLPGTQIERINRVTVDCRWCQSELERLPSELESLERGPFCDLDCYGEWLSQNVVGDDHHQWEGGTLNYGTGWWKVRRVALERDAFQCRHCGRSAEDIGRNPDVHHLKPVRDFDDPEEAHTLENVVTLCRSCHQLVENGRLDLPRSATER